MESHGIPNSQKILKKRTKLKDSHVLISKFNYKTLAAKAINVVLAKRQIDL